MTKTEKQQTNNLIRDAYRWGYASGLKAKSLELSPLNKRGLNEDFQRCRYPDI
jgi:hypothetical protein